jgi:hypothetical protein
VQAVTLRGQRVYADGKFYAEPGNGRNVAPAYQQA